MIYQINNQTSISAGLLDVYAFKYLHYHLSTSTNTSTAAGYDAACLCKYIYADIYHEVKHCELR